MPSVSVKVILSSRKEILRWQIHLVIENSSLYDFFPKVGNLIKGEFIDVNIQCELNEILQTFGNFILFELQIPEDYQPSSIQRENNAFKVLVSNSTQLALPSFKLPKKPNKKDLLCQDLVAWIKNNGGDWKGKLAAESIGKSFINYLWNSIWYVDMCGVEKLKGRSIYPPKTFEEFFNRSDPSNYKNARPKFDYDCLNRHANLLFGHLNTP
ncbi:hypothetical protein RhiirC2_796187 [Rhizophagus irregularis]|uniref:Uncharacterized protein n=1 Tax=Rhizophagus irregularis TaxID=588596 RepID=A0A2N1MA50_9GLOM|nr:hypothetical protein RhiirC2_796187 [Rhizophagus irregularis]